jgi:hypothetical protein
VSSSRISRRDGRRSDVDRTFGEKRPVQAVQLVLNRSRAAPLAASAVRLGTGFRVAVQARESRSHYGEKTSFFAEGELQFLTEEQCRSWASDRRYPLGERPYSVLADSPPFACENFTIPSDTGRRVALVRAIWSAVGSGQPEALVWITDWSVWPSSEHMPLADAVRRGLGEERPLHIAPGCLARRGEDDQVLAVLVTAVLFLWDCWLLSPDGTLAAFFSHDEYGVICGLAGVPDSLRRSLDARGLLENSETG